MAEQLKREVFGTTKDGETVYRVEIKGGGLTARIMTWGAVIQDLRLDGHEAPLLLGFDNFADYPAYSSYFGATPGRCANRIGGGKFTLDGKAHQLELNEKGVSHLHGGSDNIAKRNWTIVEHDVDRVVLKIVDPDGRAGYPGNCTIQATYRVHGNGEFSIVYESTSDQPTLASYQKLLDPQNSVGQDFLRFFWNSLFVSTATTIMSVIVAVPAAYAFSRFSFPGRNFLFFAVLLRNMFPAVIFLVPLFILMRAIGLVNTHGSLVLTYLTFGLPLAIWLLKGFYDNIPIQLEQAARIDGATRFQAFVLIVVPLSTPGIIATAIYSFIGAWNEYIYAYTFLSKNEQLTLPVGIQRFFSENTTDFPGLMAASFMMSVPVVVLFLLLQRYFVRALTEGAVKH